MYIKALHLLIIGLFISSLSFSQTIELPFIDDFEETIINDATFQNWTTENLEGWHYWHMVPGQYMRFEKTDIVQNDWLITNPINSTGAENLKVNFSHLYGTNNVPPKLYYTNQYNGNASQSAWTELSYSFGENEYQWYSSEDFIIENPGDVIYFAFHYEAAANEGAFFLLDNFNVESYTPLASFVLVGSSEHFEFYTNITGEENFYVDIKNELESKYLNYTSLWDRPGFESIFVTENKIKIKYCSRDDILTLDSEIPDWDSGVINLSNNEIFISPLISEIQQNYYTNMSSLSINELSQLALAGKLFNNGAVAGIHYQSWYLEGFGLYEMGYRPNRNDLISKLNGLGTNEPEIESVTNLQLLNEVGNKDLMASLFESKALVGCYFYLSTWNDLYYWHQLLNHYYIKDIDRIQLIYASVHFDIYGAEKEIPFVESMALSMEEKFEIQQNRFEVDINHRINICIYDNDVGLEINNRDDFQGLACGADKINTMHLDIGDFGLLHHEFMHAMVNILSNHNPGPGQFLNEGLAESTNSFMTDEEIPWHYYKIHELFYHYQRKYNREPTWLEIVDNAEVNEEDGFWVDAYALGEMYWRYMNDKYPDDFWVNVKLFLQNGRDWSVFGGKTTAQEGAEFIQFMKALASVGPPLETTPLPFNEDFETGFDGWTLMRYGVDDLWQNEENAGINESYCAYVVDPYWMEEKDVDSWLVSPPIECSGIENINVQFNYKQHGQGIKPEVYYAGNFTGTVDPVDWILVEGLSWDAPEGEWSEISFNIENAPNKLNIGVRYLSNEGNHASYFIDDFSISVNKLVLDCKVLLQGAMLSPNTGEENLMRDDLRVLGYIPTVSPYADILTCDAGVFTVTGPDAIVDWVFVELRDENNSSSSRTSRSALLQRDGDIVDLDGVSVLNVNITTGNYFVSIKHRNHLGIMSNSAIALTESTTVLDFTDGSVATHGTNAQTSLGMPVSTIGMWSGDSKGEGIVQYSGATPEGPVVLSYVLNDSSNFLNLPTFSISGYSATDVDMDGQTQYAGGTSEMPVILQNVLTNPANFLNLITWPIEAQLPETAGKVMKQRTAFEKKIKPLKN